MKLHHIKLTTETSYIDYILLLEESEVFEVMKTLTQLHQELHGNSWKALASLAV